MLNFHRVAALLAPSVPRNLRREVTAATQSPVPARLGEERVGTGKPEGGDGLLSFGPSPSSDAQATTETTPGGDRPESGTAPSLVTLPFSGPPACETQVAFYPHPSRRWEFADERLGALIDRWGGALS